MTAVPDRLDRIDQDWDNQGVNHGDVLTDLEDAVWLLALARGHQVTLEQIAEPPIVPKSDEAMAACWYAACKLARDRLREAEGE